MKDWSYEELKTNATLIVIATPTQVTVTEERAAIPGSNVAGKGLETTFEVLSVLKGELATNTIVLHHFALAKPTQDGRAPVYTDSDPRLVAFEPKEKKQYLIFVKREPDGRYVAVSGPVRPGGLDSFAYGRTNKTWRNISTVMPPRCCTYSGRN